MRKLVECVVCCFKYSFLTLKYSDGIITSSISFHINTIDPTYPSENFFANEHAHLSHYFVWSEHALFERFRQLFVSFNVLKYLKRTLNHESTHYSFIYFGLVEFNETK